MVITSWYVWLTAKTLAHFREERIGSAEPLLYLRIREGRMDSSTQVAFSLENFGRGPALRIIGTYETAAALADARIVVREINSIPDLIPVGESCAFAITFSGDDAAQLPADGRLDGFLVLRLVYEDARRNLYVYRLSTSLLAFYGSRYVQAYSEKVWRIPYYDRSYIFDNSKSALVLEYGRKPIFARSLGMVDTESDA